MKNGLIFANVVTLLIGLYFNNDTFIRLSTGGLITLLILSVTEGKS